MQSNITQDGERRETIKKTKERADGSRNVKTLYKTPSLHSSVMSQFRSLYRTDRQLVQTEFGLSGG